MTPEELEPIIESEYLYFRSLYDTWSPTTRDAHHLGVVTDALRVLINKKVIETSTAELIALGAQQNEDGGWGETATDTESKPSLAAFCALMLNRGNQPLNYERLRGSVQLAIRYFLDTQQPDGRWVDPLYSDFDTTAYSLSFFNVVLVLGKDYGKTILTKVKKSWENGIQFLLSNQSANGGWYDERFDSSNVSITANVIQDALVADVMIENVMAVSRPCRRGAQLLLSLQSENGSWNTENVHHTTSCIRALMLVSRMLGIERECDSAIQAGMAWIIENKNESGWGDFPNSETTLPRTCDGLDTILKYLAYIEEDPTKIMRYWGYLE